MPKSVEITPGERARLGRDTLLQWSVKENKAKLKALRKEIGEYLKTGATGKLEKLRAIIIKNTRKDLEKIKDMTDKERDKKAKEFADKVIRYVKENKDLNDVFFTSRVEVGPEKPGVAKNDRERLVKEWINNNPKGKIEVLEADPKYMALRDISNNLMRKEAFLLLSLIEKKWSREEAIRQYKAAWKGDAFYIRKLSDFFTKENAGPKLGIYFGARKIKWRPKLDWIDRKQVWGYPDYKGWGDWWNMEARHTVTGWWAVDMDEKNSVTIKGYQSFAKALKHVKGDEWLGTHLIKSVRNVRKELMTLKGRQGYNDSGLSVEEEREVTKLIEKAEENARNFSKSKIEGDLATWFKRQASNKWIALDKEHIGPMCYLYGDTCGKYLYRYTKDKIYAIGIDGENADPKYAGGSYIEIKNNKLGQWIGGSSREDGVKMLKEELLGQMTDAEVKKELTTIKVDRQEGSFSEKLKATERILYSLRSQLPKTVEYNRIKESYTDKLRIVLKNYLIERKGYKNKKELAEELATIRAEHVYKQINKIITDDEILSKAVEENDKEKLRISIDSSDEIEVKLFSTKSLKKWKDWAKEKTKEAVTTAKDVAENTMSKLERKLEPIFKGLTPVVMWFLDKFFKIGDVFKKMATGGTSLIGGVLTSALGIKVSKDILKSKKITNEVIEKLPPKKKKFYKFDKQMYFDEDVRLKGKKIVIPSGKGIKPGKEFEVQVKGLRDKVTVLPVKEKQFSLWGIFGRKREVYRMQEREITITDKTTIPKGTVIPKGAKIYKS